MKYIAVLALCFAAAVAVPAPGPAIPRIEALGRFNDILPKLALLRDRKAVSKLLDGPGVYDVLEQFVNGVWAIQESVESAANEIVPIIRDNNLNEQLEGELLGIVGHAAEQTSYDVADAIAAWVGYWEGYWGVGTPPEEQLSLFLYGSLIAPAFGVPIYTALDTEKVFEAASPEAGEHLKSIIDGIVDLGIEQVNKFNDVLERARVCAYYPERCPESHKL